jgi:hypothetical protein
VRTRVLRGGSFINNTNNTRAAYRNNNNPNNRNNNRGFRVSRLNFAPSRIPSVLQWCAQKLKCQLFPSRQADEYKIESPVLVVGTRFCVSAANVLVVLIFLQLSLCSRCPLWFNCTLLYSLRMAREILIRASCNAGYTPANSAAPIATANACAISP